MCPDRLMAIQPSLAACGSGPPVRSPRMASHTKSTGLRMVEPEHELSSAQPSPNKKSHHKGGGKGDSGIVSARLRAIGHPSPHAAQYRHCADTHDVQTDAHWISICSSGLTRQGALACTETRKLVFEPAGAQPHHRQNQKMPPQGWHFYFGGGGGLVSGSPRGDRPSFAACGSGPSLR